MKSMDILKFDLLLPHRCYLRFRRFHAPALMLMIFLQRAPMLRLLLPGAAGAMNNTIGVVLKCAVGLTAMGAFDSLAGATTFTVISSTGTTTGSNGSTVHLTGSVGTPINGANGVTFSVTGAPTVPKSFGVTDDDDGKFYSDTLPPGLTVSPFTGTTAGGAPFYNSNLKLTIKGTPTDAGIYTVRFWAADAVAISGVNTGYVTAVFTITGENSSAPVFSLQPVSATGLAGGSVTFSASASGNPTPTFQWYHGAAPLPGQTGTSLLLNNLQLSDAGTYKLKATNSSGTVDSNVVTLTVNTANVAPTISSQPHALNLAAGSNASFTVVAEGNPAPVYQWRKNGIDIPGATAAVLNLPNIQFSDAATYSVLVTNSAGSVASSGAALFVGEIPAITTQPLSHAAFVGDAVTMVCAVSGSPVPTYQWQKNGINIPGATNASLTISGVQLSDAGSYGLIATNPGGSAASRFARLVVLVPQQNAITYATTVSSTGVTAGGIVNFDYFVTNVGTKTWGPNHYLSIRDINNTFVAFSPLIGVLPGETTTANLNFPAPTTPGTYTYYVQALENGVEFFSTQTTVILNVFAPQANAITYNTTSFPVSAAPGSSVVFTYNVTNTGTKTWGANHFLSLKDGSGTVLSSTPLTVLASGRSKTVNLRFTTPVTPGTYHYTVQASETGVGNFGTQADLTLVVLAPQPNAIVYNRIRYPEEVAPGAMLNLKYTLSNAGTQAWGASHYVSLRDSNENYLSFLSLSGTSSGSAKTVAFAFAAPTTPGTYTYYVQSLEDGVEFFSTQDVMVITVVALPLGNAVTYNATTFPVTVAPGATVNFTANVTNRGTRTWGSTHYLSFRDVDNTFLAFPSLNGVAPGASRTSNLSFVAPSTPGIYTYKLQAFEDGISFFDMADTLVLTVQ